MPRAIGIDLGTTNSVMVDSEDPHLTVIFNAEEESHTRSIVTYLKADPPQDGAGKVLVGKHAYENWIANPTDTIVSVKRLMGRAYSDPDVQKFMGNVEYEIKTPARGTPDSLAVLLGGKEYSPPQISSLILGKLKRDAEARLKTAVTHAVITVPAHFTPVQVSATTSAARLAGLGVMHILPEPYAAAMAFDLPKGKPLTVLVYDLGGGTFDVSVIVCVGGTFANITTDGDRWLGGDDLDQLIVDAVLERIFRDHGVRPPRSSPFMTTLRDKARKVKEDLSTHSSAQLLVLGMVVQNAMINVNMVFTAEQFEQMARPLLGRYKQCSCGTANSSKASVCAATGCKQDLSSVPVTNGRAMAIVERTLAGKKLTPDSIDYVILAGNATKSPIVLEALQDFFGANKILVSEKPKDLVAKGAAKLAARLPFSWQCGCGRKNSWEDAVCADCKARLGEGVDIGQTAFVSAHNLGIGTAGDHFEIFVYKDDPYPTSESRTFTYFTQTTGQRMLVIPVYAGSDPVASKNEQNRQVVAILPARLPKDTPFEVSLWLNHIAEPQVAIRLAGEDLKAWILEGETDARVVGRIVEAQQTIESRRSFLSEQSAQLLENRLRDILGLLEIRSFDLALDGANGYLDLAKACTGKTDESLAAAGQRLAGYTSELLEEFSWALTEAKRERLRGLINEIRLLREDTDKAALATAVADIDMETDVLPTDIILIRGIRFQLTRRILPANEPLAIAFRKRLESVIDVWRQGQTPSEALNELKDEVVAAVAATEATVTESKGEICEVDGCGLSPETPGARYCPRGHDLWLPKRAARS